MWWQNIVRSFARVIYVIINIKPYTFETCRKLVLDTVWSVSFLVGGQLSVLRKWGISRYNVPEGIIIIGYEWHLSCWIRNTEQAFHHHITVTADKCVTTPSSLCHPCGYFSYWQWNVFLQSALYVVPLWIYQMPKMSNNDDPREVLCSKVQDDCNSKFRFILRGTIVPKI